MEEIREPNYGNLKEALGSGNAAMEMGYMEDDEFTRWKDEAAQKRDQCLAGELDAEEFLAWIDATSRRR